MFYIVFLLQLKTSKQTGLRRFYKSLGIYLYL